MHELAFVDAHILMECSAGGDGGLPDTDGPDFIGLDQGDVDQPAELLREREGRDPAGCSAARDYHSSDRRMLHS